MVWPLRRVHHTGGLEAAVTVGLVEGPLILAVRHLYGFGVTENIQISADGGVDAGRCHPIAANPRIAAL